MRNFIRKNFKIILAICVTAVICISGTAFATYQYKASQIEYNGKSVEDALNDLYEKLISNLNYDILYHYSNYSGYTHNYTITEENTKYKYLLIIAYSANISMSPSPANITIINDNVIPILNPDYMQQTEYGSMLISSDIYVGMINNPMKDDIISIIDYYCGQALILGIK